MHSSDASTVMVDDDQQPSLAVIEFVARVVGVDPLELDPLYDVIDPDALNALCDSSSGFTRLEFSYHGYPVAVTATNGDIEISLADVTVSVDETPTTLIDTQNSR